MQPSERDSAALASPSTDTASSSLHGDSGPVSGDVQTFIRNAQNAIRELVDAIRPPAAPDTVIRAWPLSVDFESGDIWCGDVDHDCYEEGKLVEGSDIDGEQVVFTIDDVYRAVGDHIAMIREWAEERAADEIEASDDLADELDPPKETNP